MCICSSGSRLVRSSSRYQSVRFCCIWHETKRVHWVRSTCAHICITSLDAKQNEQLENVQKKATKWINSSYVDYKDRFRFRTFTFLPLSQYMELHDFLIFIDISNNKFDYQLLVLGDEQYFTRQGVSVEFPLAKYRLTRNYA